jgi:hypothetical protein
MKRVFTAFVFITITIFLVACTSTPTPKGIIYTSTKGPFYATANEKSVKMGTGTTKCILGIVAWGDASAETAAKNAGITKIHHVDYEDTLILLGIYSSYTVVVYGE